MPLRLFKAAIQDLSRANRFLIWCPGMPPDLVFHCINANIPGESFSTTNSYDPDIGTNVIPWELPYDITQNECSLTFMCDPLFRIRNYFDKWREQVFDPKYGFGYLQGDGGYAKTIKIFALSRQHIPTYTVELTDAWPKTITDTNFDSGQQNTPAVFTVNLVYGGQIRQDSLGFVLDKIGVKRPDFI